MMRWAAGVLVVAATVVLAVSSVNAANRIEFGAASTYGNGYNGWLALPEGPGFRVEIGSMLSGHRRCAIRTSNDAGPDLAMQRAGRIADLDIVTFQYLCLCNWRVRGTIPVSVEYLGGSRTNNFGPQITLPPTDTEEGQTFRRIVPF